MRRPASLREIQLQKIKAGTECCNGYPFRETTVCVSLGNLIAMDCKPFGFYFFFSTGNYTVFSVRFPF